MSETKQALAELNSFIVALRRASPPGTHSECRRRADLLDPNEAEALPSEDALASLRRDLHAACSSGAVGTMPPRLLRSAPLVFWNGDPQAAGFPNLLDEFVKRTMDSQQTRHRWVRNLIEAWLRDFGPDKIRHPEAGKAISLMLSRSEHASLHLWRSADAKFALFDAGMGPKRVAQTLIGGPETVADILRQIGMHDPLRATGGFFRAAVAQMISELPQSLSSRLAAVAWERSAGLLEITRTERDHPRREFTKPALRFPEMSGEVARASLSPWLAKPSIITPPRDVVKAFLLRTIGDPRLNEHKSAWLGAGSAATKLMRSWLAAETLEAFFSLISQSNDDQQWRYRRAFWRACLKKIPDAEVWVVLGSALSGRAGAIRDLNGSFGTFAGSTASGDQAAFLMRLGDLILSEWSNVGAVRAWAVGGKHCPALYRDSYHGFDLKAPCLDFPNHPTRGNGGSFGGRGLYHHSSASGLWQGCVAALLRNRLGINLSPSDYMP
jgi:hypothetical protein